MPWGREAFWELSVSKFQEISLIGLSALLRAWLSSYPMCLRWDPCFLRKRPNKIATEFSTRIISLCAQYILCMKNSQTNNSWYPYWWVGGEGCKLLRRFRFWRSYGNSPKAFYLAGWFCIRDKNRSLSGVTILLEVFKKLNFEELIRKNHIRWTFFIPGWSFCGGMVDPGPSERCDPFFTSNPACSADLSLHPLLDYIVAVDLCRFWYCHEQNSSWSIHIYKLQTR